MSANPTENPTAAAADPLPTPSGPLSPTRGAAFPQLARVEQAKAAAAVHRQRAAEVAAQIEAHVAATEAQIDALRRELTLWVAGAVAEQESLLAAASAAEAEVETLCTSPVLDDEDPTIWLPDELLIEVLVLLDDRTLWSGAVALTCRRWAGLSATPRIVQRLRDSKWPRLSEGIARPRTISTVASPKNLGFAETHLLETFVSLAVGPRGLLYAGSKKGRIHRFDFATSAHIEFGECGRALAVGADGTVFSTPGAASALSGDCTIRSWSPDGAPLRTLRGHKAPVTALAVAPNGMLVSGGADCAVMLWTGNAPHCETRGRYVTSSGVACIVVGPDGVVYSGSRCGQVIVWTADLKPVQATRICNTGTSVIGLALSPEGGLFIVTEGLLFRAAFDGSKDLAVEKFWRPMRLDGGQRPHLRGLAIAPDSTVLVLSDHGLHVRRTDAEALIVVAWPLIEAIAVGPNGTLFTAGLEVLRWP